MKEFKIETRETHDLSIGEIVKINGKKYQVVPNKTDSYLCEDCDIDHLKYCFFECDSGDVLYRFELVMENEK